MIEYFHTNGPARVDYELHQPVYYLKCTPWSMSSNVWMYIVLLGQLHVPQDFFRTSFLTLKSQTSLFFYP